VGGELAAPASIAADDDWHLIAGHHGLHPVLDGPPRKWGDALDLFEGELAALPNVEASVERLRVKERLQVRHTGPGDTHDVCLLASPLAPTDVAVDRKQPSL